MIISHFPGGGAGKKTGIPEFTYTGSAQVIDEGDNNWRIKFLTSGTFKVNSDCTVEVFAVGGGGGGGNVAYAGGGGGGRTATAASVNLISGVEYLVTVGDGGNAGTPGGESSFAGILTAAGGDSPSGTAGGAGGSGGGGGSNTSAGGAGGSDGSDGAAGKYGSGAGQGTTTREFGESTGTLYAGGGGGGGAIWDKFAPGGEGGGGNGGQTLSSGAPVTKGVENTGGGGGGGGTKNNGAKGGSGIIVIRNVRY